jgi:hypothetical protein
MTEKLKEIHRFIFIKENDLACVLDSVRLCIILPQRTAAITSYTFSEDLGTLEICCTAPAHASSFNYHSVCTLRFSKMAHSLNTSSCEDILRNEKHNLTEYMIEKLLSYI